MLIRVNWRSADLACEHVREGRPVHAYVNIKGCAVRSKLELGLELRAKV